MVRKHFHVGDCGGLLCHDSTRGDNALDRVGSCTSCRGLPTSEGGTDDLRSSCSEDEVDSDSYLGGPLGDTSMDGKGCARSRFRGRGGACIHDDLAGPSGICSYRGIACSTRHVVPQGACEDAD